MEIYDYKSLESLKKRSWNYGENQSPSDDGIKPILSSDKEIEMGDVLIINKVAYSVCTIHFKRENDKSIPVWCLVDKLEKQKAFITDDTDVEEVNYSSEVTCPYCGHEYGDSWEMSDGEEDYECGECGSHFSYQRAVTIEYCSQPIKRNDVKEI